MEQHLLAVMEVLVSLHLFLELLFIMLAVVVAV
jgi:hypothetical protein